MISLKQRRLAKEKAKQEALEAEKKEKEIQAKINIRKSLSAMKKQSQKLERFKNDYIEKAKKAALVGDTRTGNLARSGLKMCISKQKVIDTMIASFEISMQLNDMNRVIVDFVGGMNTISEQMREVTAGVDMNKAQLAYEKAIANNEGQYQALDAFLETASDSITAFEGSDADVSDEEIDKLINNGAADSEDSIDKEIEEKIADVQSKLTM